MAQYVCNGAFLMCTMAVPQPAPTLLIIAPHKSFLNMQPMATYMDFVPFKNIPTFGMCCSPDHEGVQAAMGSPVPCTPLVIMPWDSPKSDVMTKGGNNALLSDCTCSCELGQGTISIISPGQAKAKEK